MTGIARLIKAAAAVEKTRNTLKAADNKEKSSQPVKTTAGADTRKQSAPTVQAGHTNGVAEESAQIVPRIDIPPRRAAHFEQQAVNTGVVENITNGMYSKDTQVTKVASKYNALGLYLADDNNKR